MWVVGQGGVVGQEHPYSTCRGTQGRRCGVRGVEVWLWFVLMGKLFLLWQG